VTDFEMVSVFTDLVSTLWTVFATYVSIIFAFLVVSYLASRTLQPVIVAIIVSLYTLVAAWAIWALNRSATLLVAVAGEMKRNVADGSSALDWHPAAQSPDFLIAVVPALVTIIALLAYFGSLFFFYYERKYPAISDSND
jgi:hypothetical protein